MGVAVVLGLICALGLALNPGIADAKGKKKHKKKTPVTLMTRNLYLGSDLTQALNEAVQLGKPGHQDSYADAVGQVMQNVNQSDFGKRAITLAQEIKNNRPDLVGLQEAALWRIQIPTDGTPLNPGSDQASTVAFDFIQQLLDQLNAGAQTKKSCKKKGIKPNNPKCFRGYTLVTSQDEFDFESFADFDHDPGPNGKTFDVTASTSSADTAKWLDGNDDTGVAFGEPPAAQCSDGKDNDGDGASDYGPGPAGGDQQCTSYTDNDETRPPQCLDGVDNDGDTLTDVIGGDPECDPAPGAPPTTAAFDDSEATDGFQSKPSGLPQDANFDSHLFSSSPNAGLAGPDLNGNGLDPSGTTDCPDNRAASGPAFGAGGGAWPFTGYDGDEDPNTPGSQVEVCVFHGIDMDIRLTMRDAIIARKGAGVHTFNASNGHFGTHLQYSASGIPIPVTRGWNAVDANVRGHQFHLVNTHLEAFDSLASGNPTNAGPVNRGNVRLAQAQQLLAGPLNAPLRTILVGDLNSNNPPVQQGDELAYNALTGAGFLERTSTPTSCCYDDITNPNSPGLDHQVDHVMTNDPAVGLRSSFITTTFSSGLWSSDHAGVVSQLDMPGGGKKKHKKHKK